MKKILYMIGAVLLFSSAWADSPNSHITMVTYFPTPYMVYQDVKVKGPCEVGIMNNCSLQAKKDLLMNYVQVKNGYNVTLKGKNVNSSSSPVTTLKSGNGGNTSTRGTLQFGHNLTVNNMSTVRSIESSALALNALYLGGKEFPACNDYTDSSNHDVKWQNLNVDGGKSGVYLVCGNGKKISSGETTDPDPDPDPDPTCSKTCPSGQFLRKSTCECVPCAEGNITYHSDNPVASMTYWDSYTEQCITYSCSGSKKLYMTGCRDLHCEVPTCCDFSTSTGYYYLEMDGNPIRVACYNFRNVATNGGSYTPGTSLETYTNGTCRSTGSTSVYKQDIEFPSVCNTRGGTRPSTYCLTPSGPSNGGQCTCNTNTTYYGTKSYTVYSCSNSYNSIPSGQHIYAEIQYFTCKHKSGETTQKNCVAATKTIN